MGIGGALRGIVGAFSNKQKMSSLERAGYAIDKTDNFTKRMEAYKPFYQEWSKMQLWEVELAAGEKPEATDEETGKMVTIDKAELMRRERNFIHTAHGAIQTIALPYFRSMDNEQMCQKLLDWTDIYIDYKMREARYTIGNEAEGSPLRTFRLQAIGGLFKVMGMSYGSEDITAKDVFIIPQMMPPGGNVLIRKPAGQDED